MANSHTHQRVYIFDIDGVFNDMDNSTPRKEIIEFVAKLLAASVPVAINTGRDYAWINVSIIEKVSRLLNSRQRLDSMCVVSEFGGNFTTYSGGTEVTKTTELALKEAVKQIARKVFYDSDVFQKTMRENTAKKTIVTFGKKDEISHDAYKESQLQLTAELTSALKDEGVKVNPTTNAVDVHHPDAGKWTGSQTIATWLAQNSYSYSEVICLGDSHIDFDMAGYFSENGYDTTLVFTGPDFKENHGYNALKIIKTERPYYLGAYDYLKEQLK